MNFKQQLKDYGYKRAIAMFLIGFVVAYIIGQLT